MGRGDSPSPEEWAELKELFHRAADLPAGEREDFVGRTTAGKPRLRRRLEALLDSDSDDSRFLVEPVERWAELAATEHPDPVAGGGHTRIGPYRLVRELGRGGMGAVHLAERTDGEYRQRVAIKVLRGTLAGEKVVERFRQERQILARLDHPDIARLLDGGTTPEGTPYLVMEYIEGEPIDVHCDARRLDIDARLALFRQVCEAVAYAHRNLVIHRDIKPSNLLITGEGRPKLLDFGIAKLLGAEAERRNLTTMAPAMTPEYASPEQVRGQAATTATDVYQLGLLLYELLTGRRACRIETPTPEGVLRAVCERQPERPSTAVTRPAPEAGAEAPTASALAAARSTLPDRLRRRLDGDLDNIILKALRKEPERRYASVEHLSEDLERHLEGLPVRARRPTLRYRAGKFVRRHAVGLAASLLIAASLVAAVAGIAWQGRRAAREAAKAREVSGFLEEMLASPDPEELGRHVTVREVLDVAAETIDERFARQARVRGSLHRTIGRSYLALGLHEEATGHLREAVEIQRAELGAGHPETLRTSVDLAAALSDAGAVEEHRELARRIWQRAHELHGAEHPVTLYAAAPRAWALYAEGELEPALELLRSAYAGQQRLLGLGHRETLDTLHELCRMLTETGRYDEGERLARTGIEAAGAALGEEHPRTLELSVDLAVLLTYDGRAAEAEPIVREVAGRARRVWGEDHPRTLEALTQLAGILGSTGKLEEAEELYSRVLEGQRRVLGEEHESYLATLASLANLYSAMDRHADAEAVARDAWERYRRVAGEDYLPAIWTLHNLTAALRYQGKLAEAEPLARRELELLAGHFEPDNPNYVWGVHQLAAVLVEQRRFREAADLLGEALPAARRAFPDGHTLLWDLVGQHGRALAGLGDLERGEELLLEALESFRTVDPELEGIAPRRLIGYLAEVYETWGKPGKRLEVIRSQ